ncbi:unnamed protein product [Larinioides sclopetarius]|uniref:mRNA-decapping enzyme 1A n=2 Tax=Larinioides sclopetarius TaxID=280406 RepID=A0AAV1ZUM3_9ARAC
MHTVTSKGLKSQCEVIILKPMHTICREGTDIEGTLFLYRRSVHPRYGLIIVNRMNTTNFIESITGDMQFQLQEPYLLYKNHSGEIIGSWFYEEKDLRRITKKIQTIILQLSGRHPRMRCASDSDTKDVASSPNIIALLSHAQDEYMKTVSQNQNHKSNDNVDFNNLSAHSEKKALEKSVELFSKRARVATTRSASQENYTTSPRRRFMSTGSFDADRIKEYSLDPLVNTQRMKESGRKEKNKLKDFSSCLFNRGEWVAPTRLSPLFSHNEISSPASDIIFKDTSSKTHYSDPFPTYCKNNLSSCQSSGVLDWKAYLGPDCDTHFSNMKRVLKTHIQDNPPVMLKIHEAYVSSLRSLFTKN